MLDMHGSFYGDVSWRAAHEAAPTVCLFRRRREDPEGISTIQIQSVPRISRLRIAVLSLGSPGRSVAGG